MRVLGGPLEGVGHGLRTADLRRCAHLHSGAVGFEQSIWVEHGEQRTATPTTLPPSAALQYQPYWAARAELLTRTGAQDEAHRAYEIAIGLERDPAVRRFLQRRQERDTHLCSE